MAFGFTKANYNASTPKNVNTIVNIASVALPVIVAYVSGDPYISAFVKTEVAGIGAMLIGLAHGIRPFFGTPDDQAPASDKEPIK